MIGITNAIQNRIRQAVMHYDNLQVWLDGTDFFNHGVNQDYTITNGNNFNELVMQTIKNNEVSTYYKKAAANRDNGIKITPTALMNYTIMTMCAWGMRAANNNYMNFFTCGKTSSPIIEIRLRYTTDNQISWIHGSGTGQTFEYFNVGMSINEWAFLASIINGSSQKLFYNGVLIQETTATNEKTSIDCWNILGGTCWNDGGGISYCTDYRYYDIALSDEEIMAIYEAGPQQHRN